MAVLKTHFLTGAKEICEVLNVSRTALWRLIQSTNIPIVSQKIDGHSTLLAIKPVLKYWQAEFYAGKPSASKKQD